MDDRCPLCALPPREHSRVWHAYGSRLRLADAVRQAQRLFDRLGSMEVAEDAAAEEAAETRALATLALSAGEISEELVRTHLFEHHWEQPRPLGTFDRSEALQEAMTAFKTHHLWMLRAIWRARALTRKQIHALFYLHAASEGADLSPRLDEDLRRMVFRNFLYQHFPENKGALKFEDEGPYFFLNRQAIPIVERLEGVELMQGTYNTNLEMIEEFYLEHDTRYIDVIVAMREALYQRELVIAGNEMVAHVGIEHWYAPHMMSVEMPVPGARPGMASTVPFAPAALLGVKAQTRDGRTAGLMPLWLEYDRGSQEPREFAESILFYGAFYASDHYREQFPRLVEANCTGPLVIVCDDPWRTRALATELRGLIGDREVPLYVVDRPSVLTDPWADDILLAPSDPSRRFSIADRLLHHCRPLLEGHVYGPDDRLHDPPPHVLLAAASGGAALPGPSPALSTPAAPSAEVSQSAADLSAWK